MVTTYFNDNKYHFSITAPSGNVLLTSVSFKDENSKNRALAHLCTTPLTNRSIERTTTHAGRFLFRVKDHDGQVIAHSLSYCSEAGMENGIKNFGKALAALKKEEY